MDDGSLVARAADGDSLAFELLVRRHSEAVWRLARSVLDDRFTAEDVVQDTFVKAHRGLRGYRGDAAVRTWLLSICYRTCLDRRRRREAHVVPLEQVRDRPATEACHDLRIALKEALADLPDDQYRAFVLVHVLGYSREEAAGIAEVPASTMRSRVAMACDRLAIAMGLWGRRRHA